MDWGTLVILLWAIGTYQCTCQDSQGGQLTPPSHYAAKLVHLFPGTFLELFDFTRRDIQQHGYMQTLCYPLSIIGFSTPSLTSMN